MGEKKVAEIKGTLEWMKNDVSPYPGQVVFSMDGPDIDEYVLGKQLRVKSSVFDIENATWRTVRGEILITLYQK